MFATVYSATSLEKSQIRLKDSDSKYPVYEYDLSIDIATDLK